MAAREKKPVVAAAASKTPRKEKLLTSTLRKYNSLAEAKKELLRLSQDVNPVVKRPVGRPRKHGDLLETCSTSGDSSTRGGATSGRLVKKRFSRASLEAGNGVGRNSPYSFRSQGLLRNGKRRTLDGVDLQGARRRVASLCTGSVEDLRCVGRRPGRPSLQSLPQPEPKEDKDDDLGRHISSRIAALIKKSKVSEILQKYSEAKASRKAAQERKLMDTNSNLCGSVPPVPVVPPPPAESATSLATPEAPGNLPCDGDVAPNTVTVGGCDNLRKRINKVNSSVKRKLKITAGKGPRKVVVDDNQRTNLTAKKLVVGNPARRPRNLAVAVPFKGPARVVTKIKTEPPFTNDDDDCADPVVDDCGGGDKPVVPLKVDGDDVSKPSPVDDVSVSEFSETSPVKSETVVSVPCENSCSDVEDAPVCAVNGEVVVAGEQTKDEEEADVGRECNGGVDDEPAEVTKDDAEEGDDAPVVVGDAKEQVMGEEEEEASAKDVTAGDGVVVQGGDCDVVSVEAKDEAGRVENGEIGTEEDLSGEQVTVSSVEVPAILSEPDGLDGDVVPVVGTEESGGKTEDVGGDEGKVTPSPGVDDGVQTLEDTQVEEILSSTEEGKSCPEAEVVVSVSTPEPEDVVRVPSSEPEDVLTVSTPEPEDLAMVSTPQTEDLVTVSTLEADDVVTLPTPETEDLVTLPTPEAEDVVTLPTRVSEDVVTVSTREAEDMGTLPTSEPEDVVTLPTSEREDVVTLPTSEREDVLTVLTPEAEDVVTVSTPEPESEDVKLDALKPETVVKLKDGTSPLRRRRSTAVKEKQLRGCVKRSLSAECTERDVLENNQCREQSAPGPGPAKATYIIISKEKEAAEDDHHADFQITVGPDETPAGGGHRRVDEETNKAKVAEAVADTVVAQESAEEQAVKESVLRALGLTSWRAAQEAVARQGKNSTQTYTGTLKTVIKVQRSPEKRRRSLKMVLKHCSNGSASAQGGAHAQQGARAASQDVHYRICKETDASTGGSLGAGNRKYSKTSQGYQRYLSEHDSNSSSSGNNAVEKACGSAATTATVTTSAVEELKEEGKSDKSSLVIPEKSASFSIHPGRLCSDVCSYCFGKFGSLDTPCHVAQLKSEDRQRKILDIETQLTMDSCLCDACYRYVDRKANCPSYKPARKRHHRAVGSTSAGGGGAAAGAAPTCSAVGCQEAARHHVRRKWLLKLKRSISKKVPVDTEKPHLHFGFCQQHFNWLDYYMVCGICSRRLTRSHMYALGGSEVRDLNQALLRDGIPARVSDKRFLCKLCRYYASLRAKCKDPKQLTGNQKMFFQSYRKRILQYHDVEVVSEPEEEEAAAVAPPKAKRKKTSGGGGSRVAAGLGLVEHGTSESSVEEDRDRLQAGTPTMDYSKLAGLTVTPVQVPPGRVTAPEEEDLPPVRASLSFHGPRGGWERCSADLQFTAETKRLFQTLQRPYGSHSSFIRHLVLMEKFWRQGDLVLAPRASARAANYVNSVQHRLRAFDYTPPTALHHHHSSLSGGGTNSVSVIPVPDPPAVSVVELPLRPATTLQQLYSQAQAHQPQPRPTTSGGGSGTGTQRKARGAAAATTVCRISEVRSLAPEQTRWSCWGSGKGTTIVTPTGIVLSRNPEISVSSVVQRASKS